MQEIRNHDDRQMSFYCLPAFLSAILAGCAAYAARTNPANPENPVNPVILREPRAFKEETGFSRLAG
jgi:hypothetical protein